MSLFIFMYHTIWRDSITCSRHVKVDQKETKTLINNYRFYAINVWPYRKVEVAIRVVEKHSVKQKGFGVDKLKVGNRSYRALITPFFITAKVYITE